MYTIITLIINKCYEHQTEAVMRNKDNSITIMWGMPVHTINIEKRTNQEKKSGSLSLQNNIIKNEHSKARIQVQHQRKEL